MIIISNLGDKLNNKDIKKVFEPFYRLKNKIEIENLGIFENLDKNIILVEWPELIENKPNNRIELFFEY